MNNSYIKQGRIDTLWKFYLRNNYNYDLTYTRAIRMGVTRSTALGYMDVILSRVDKVK